MHAAAEGIPFIEFFGGDVSVLPRALGKHRPGTAAGLPVAGWVLCPFGMGQGAGGSFPVPAAGPSLSQDFATPAFHYRSLPQPLLRDSTKLPPAISIPLGEAGRVIHDTFFLSGGAPAGRGPAAEPPARSLPSPQTLAGKGAGKAAPKPCGSFAHPGLAGRCCAAGCPHPAVLGPWGQGVLPQPAPIPAARRCPQVPRSSPA